MDDEVIDNPELESSLRKGGAGVNKKAPKYEPIYMMTANKVPVSKKMGKVWQSRRDQALQAAKNAFEAWREAIRYYDNDQLEHRTTGDTKKPGNRKGIRGVGENFTETENIVFANTSTMLPLLYARNPTVEVTAWDQQKAPVAAAFERLTNTLLQTRDAPGLNLKPKARRCVLTALLTNTAIIRVGYTPKQESSEQALNDLKTLSDQLANAKDRKEIEEVEGKLLALEETIDLLTPAGPTLKVISPFNLLLDPCAQEPDGRDANWMMERDWLPTSLVNAKFTTKDENGNRVYTYKPTHIVKASGTSDSAVEDEVNNFTLLGDDQDDKAKQFGYADQASFERAQMTEVWWVWDRVTRRVYLFHSQDWATPMWVWQDPLNLIRFFPYHIVHFHESVEGTTPKGEVTYYLDQQDAINEINSEVRNARAWARRNIFYDKNRINQEDVNKVLSGPDGTARGIDVPEGAKLGDLIFSITPPGIKVPELFDKRSKYDTISRLTSVKEVMQGVQFKTNTTNEAIAAYGEGAQNRIDEKTDAIEDWIGDIGWSIMQLCAQYMDPQQVAALIGAQAAKAFITMTPQQMAAEFACSVVGGSGEKPTSRRKKKEALELGQILGQFANASPAIVVVLLKAFQQAFDELVITDADWEMIIQSMMMQQQKAGAGPGGGDEQQPPTDVGQDAQPQEGGDEQSAQIKEIIAQLPDDRKQQLQQMVESGMPPTKALEQVLVMMKQPK